MHTRGCLPDPLHIAHVRFQRKFLFHPAPTRVSQRFAQIDIIYQTGDVFDQACNVARYVEVTGCSMNNDLRGAIGVRIQDGESRGHSLGHCKSERLDFCRVNQNIAARQLPHHIFVRHYSYKANPVGEVELPNLLS